MNRYIQLKKNFNFLQFIIIYLKKIIIIYYCLPVFSKEQINKEKIRKLTFGSIFVSSKNLFESGKIAYIKRQISRPQTPLNSFFVSLLAFALVVEC